MADPTRVRDPLELAAASPDPHVRQLALSVKRKKAEIAALETFFATYGSAVAETGAVETAHAPRASRKDATGDVIAEIMAEIGAPVDLDTVYDSYRVKNPSGSLGTRDSLRVAMTKRKDKFCRGDDGLWRLVNGKSPVFA